MKMVLMRIVGTAVLLLAFVCNAEVIFHPVPLAPSLQSSIENSGYHALFNAGRFVMRAKPLVVGSVVHDFKTYWIMPDYSPGAGQKTTKDVFDSLRIVFLGTVKAGRSSDGTNFVLSYELENWLMGQGIKVFNALKISNELKVVDNIERQHLVESLSLIDANPNSRVGWIINASPDLARPHWVAVGIFKWDDDYHVCTMDSVAGSTVFSPDDGIARTALELRIAQVLEPASVVMPSPVASRRSSAGSLPGFDLRALDGEMYDGDGRDGAQARAGSGTPVAARRGSDASAISGYDPEAFWADVVPHSDDDAPLPYNTAENDPIGLKVLRPADEGGAPIFSDTEVDDDGEPAIVGVTEATAAVFGGDAGGLWNNSNTCYQNALFQAINKCEPLMAQLMAGYERRIAPVNVLSPLVRNFFRVEQQLSDPTIDQGALDPLPFCVAVQNLWQDHRIGIQQDAAGFMQKLWGQFELEQVVPIPARYDDGFHGVAEQTFVTCMKCRDEHSLEASSRLTPEQPVLTYQFSLSFPPGGPGRWVFNDLLDHYLKLEFMEEGNALKCPRCQTKRSHSTHKVFKIARQQRFLVIHLMRFAYDGRGASKLVAPVIFPADGIVAFTDSEGCGHRFKVTSIVVHKGSLSSGHYWAVGWDRIYNDSSVTNDNEAMPRLLRTGGDGSLNDTGYLYFLERVGEAEFPAPGVGVEEEKPPVVGYDDDGDE